MRKFPLPRKHLVGYAGADKLPSGLASVGTFGDSQFPAPTVSVYAARRPGWTVLGDEPGQQHYD